MICVVFVSMQSRWILTTQAEADKWRS